MSGPTRRLPAIYTATAIALGVIAAVEAAWLAPYIASQDALGVDLRYFQAIAQHWLDTGEFYQPHQLTGPYVVQTLVDVLYPPFALYLFVPFIYLPPLLWWLAPITMFVGGIVRLHPARWTWPLIMLGVAWPLTVSSVLFGNSNMWVAGFIALGVNFAWPSVLVLFKPSLVPFILVGIRHRSWWVALAVVVAAAIPFGTLWLDYATAMRNSSLEPGHALLTVPLMLAPLVAWLGRTRSARTQPLQADPSTGRVPHIDDLTTGEVK